MKLILSRHGNTFGPADTPVWVGAGQDMPLVEKGVEQAQALGAYLDDQGIFLDAVYCAPLKRTCEYAAVVSSIVEGPAPIIEPALTEIDYGCWGGKTNDYIAKHFGKSVLEAWQQKGVWPANADWSPSEEDILENIQSFADGLVQHHGDEVVMVVSSNGILRYFLTLVEDAFQQLRREQKLKVATGNICQLAYKKGAFSLDFWNQEPVSSLSQSSQPSAA